MRVTNVRSRRRRMMLPSVVKQRRQMAEVVRGSARGLERTVEKRIVDWTINGNRNVVAEKTEGRTDSWREAISGSPGR